MSAAVHNIFRIIKIFFLLGLSYSIDFSPHGPEAPGSLALIRVGPKTALCWEYHNIKNIIYYIVHYMSRSQVQMFIHITI